MPTESTPTPALATPLRRRSWLRPLLIALAAWVVLQSWQSYTDRKSGVALAALAKPGDIVMLSSETCAYCKSARRFMTEHQIPFSECFIETDAACAESYRAQQAPGTPTLLVRGQRLVGFDPKRIAKVLGG
jgi:glutaredoxin